MVEVLHTKDNETSLVAETVGMQRQTRQRVFEVTLSFRDLVLAGDYSKLKTHKAPSKFK